MLHILCSTSASVGSVVLSVYSGGLLFYSMFSLFNNYHDFVSLLQTTLSLQ